MTTFTCKKPECNALIISGGLEPNNLAEMLQASGYDQVFCRECGTKYYLSRSIRDMCVLTEEEFKQKFSKPPHIIEQLQRLRAMAPDGTQIFEYEADPLPNGAPAKQLLGEIQHAHLMVLPGEGMRVFGWVGEQVVMGLVEEGEGSDGAAATAKSSRRTTRSRAK